MPEQRLKKTRDAYKETEWMCSCGTLNKTFLCQNCGDPIPPEEFYKLALPIDPKYNSPNEG